ncbi:oxidoreductase [Candidatus Roizmanbacteria bacterium RIFCSPHIGHO2_01_FULL_39_8]|uniref:Oxidoreductase n=1 Tax=Candidatus Roizmanbacteria bacterium RIFCSPHIGHO2_01_FULL_39_8 TaxID=1802033 RepID=A0A1F7GTE8_9BACT|nr:MAG: oxidoreductase [Candidatus Roizmanbacteria bacterium RIFCSPHIGHO2_01_FULL_39_8]
MRKVKFAVFGAGFWAKYQIVGWKELKEAELVAIYNRTRSKAEKLAREFKIPRIYDNPHQLFKKEKLDFVDIITDVSTHKKFVLLAAENKVPVICQKPMAPTYEEAKLMVSACKKAKTPFFVHENWRWQTPIRALKSEMQRGAIGKIFRARISYCNSFPVFKNQPFLKNLKQFILTDMGTHILDVARFLFGEAESIYCQIASVTPGIKGEDVATLSMKMKSGSHCLVEMSYASILEHEKFPQTFIVVEGEKGSIELTKDYWIRITTKEGTKAKQHAPKIYSWVDPKYAVVQSSIVDANRNFLEYFQGKRSVETTGEDNLKTLQLVYSAYESAKTNSVIKM